VAYVPRDGPGPDAHGELVEFGSRRPGGGRWGPRALITCLVLAAAVAVTVTIRSAGDQGRPAARAAAAPPPLRITKVGHPLLGVTAGWELFARGPDDVLRIELALGRIIQTYVPALETASPDVAFVVGPHSVVIRPSDLVPGYLVPDNGQAQPLAGLLATDGPMIPGPAGSQAVWVTTGAPTTPSLALVTLAGHRSGRSISFQPSGPQLPSTAVTDGRGDVLVTDGHFDVYDAGPGWDRPVPGTVIAVGPADWLVDVCNAEDRDCRNEVISTGTGAMRTVPGPAVTGPSYIFSWPPTGVISPDGSMAAVAENGPNGAVTVHLIDLRTGATRDLGVILGGPSGDLPLGVNANQQAMAWSPDGHWLFVAAAGGNLVVVNPRTGTAQSLGVRLPAVEQVAIRP
jgi:hypothetical protein